MKRILALSLVGALALGMFATGVAGAHSQGQGHEGEGGHYSLTWVPCTPSTINGLNVYAVATPAVVNGTMWATVAVKHAETSAILTATAMAAILPTSGIAPATTFVGHGMAVFSFKVPSNSTVPGTATVTITGTYASQSFSCAPTAPVVASNNTGKHGAWVACVPPAVSGLNVSAKATPAVVGGTMRAEVKVKHGSSSAILTATASAAIPPGGPVAPATTFIGHASASFTFNVLSTAPVGGTATVTINGTYATTPFTCQVTATVVAATHHDEGDDEGNGDNQGNGGHED